VGRLYEIEQNRIRAEKNDLKKTKSEIREALEEVREEALILVDAGLGDEIIQVGKYSLPAGAILKILWRV